MTLKAEKRARRAAEEAERAKKPRRVPAGVQCFMLEPLQPAQVRHWLRRYVGSATEKCSVEAHGFHNAMTLLGDCEQESLPEPPHHDPRWPTQCVCGRAFTETDSWQVFASHLFRRADTGVLTTIDEAGPGAMWFDEWLGTRPHWCGPDGKSLHVVLPDGRQWCVDSRARNCGLPKDDVHKCWIRHGVPPNITVDKDGVTCNAGAGSIDTGTFHGFLRGGRFHP